MNNLKNYIIIIFLGLTSPLLTFLMASFSQKLKIDQRSREILMIGALFSCVVILSYINSGKLVEGDLANYFKFFKNAQHLNFFDYMNSSRGLQALDLRTYREPIFYTFLFLMRHFEYTNFVFIFTFFCYSFTFVHIVLFGRDVRAPTIVIYLSCITIGLFFVNFSLSAHLMRQFMGCAFLTASILSTARSKYIQGLLYMFVAILTHNMFFLFLVLYFFKDTNRNEVGESKKSSFLLKFVIFGILSGILILGSGLFQIFYYYFSVRFTEGSSSLDSVPITYLSAGMTSLLLLVLGIKSSKQDQTSHSLLRLLVIITIIIMALIIVGYMNSKYNDIGIRYFSVLFFLLPLVMLAAYHRLQSLIYFPIVFVLGTTFMYFTARSVWNYPFIGEMITGGMFWRYLL